MLKPTIKTVSALIPIMCILAFIFKNNKINAAAALTKPLAKKKYNGGNLSTVMLFSIKIENNIICSNKGIFRCEMSDSITLSIFPKVRKRKKNVIGNRKVIMIT